MMDLVDLLPAIKIVGSEQSEMNHESYFEVIRCTLARILPSEFFCLDVNANDRFKYLQSLLPFVKMVKGDGYPCNMSFLVISKYRLYGFKFFFEMISRWLLPGRNLNFSLLYVADFCFPDMSDEVLALCEVKIRVESQEEYHEIQQRFPEIENEIILGISSSYYARRILEAKGMSDDEKRSYVQKNLSYLINRFPNEFQNDILSEMMHVLVTCPDEFKSARTSRHLSRVISIQYLFRKYLATAVKKSPKKRHIFLKAFHAHIQTAEGKKKVIGILGGGNFLQNQENFEERHLLKAIQQHIPLAQVIPNSFFTFKRGSGSIATFYFEVEKSNGEAFNPTEIKTLCNELPVDLKNRVELKLHPMIVPRNEEEVMRNILSLNSQLKYLRDVPQVFTSFDEQSHSNLYFTVIVVRVIRPHSCAMQDLFNSSNTFLEYIHDQTRMIGFIRKKHPKEATVFRIKLPKELFLRLDHSIDLYKARQAVVAELTRILGEIRDYNGGMISRQHELLTRVRDLLVDIDDWKDLLLENFFYSLAPVVMRTLLDPHAFKTLFLMLLKALKDFPDAGEAPSLNIYAEPQYVFAMISAEDPTLKEKIHKVVHKLHLTSTESAHAYVKVQERFYLGYIYCSTEIHQRDLFCKALQQVCHSKD